MRVLVVSDRRLSNALLAQSVGESSSSQLVGQVSHLRDAQTWCDADKADAVLADAEIVAREIIASNFGLETQVSRALFAQDRLQTPILSEGDLATRAFCISVQRVSLLSSREREVFFLLGLGFSNRRIARKLDIAESTVKSHIGQILKKLMIESRLEAGLAALAYLLRSSNEEYRVA